MGTANAINANAKRKLKGLIPKALKNIMCEMAKAKTP
jgi:hypothetical protein